MNKCYFCGFKLERSIGWRVTTCKFHPEVLGNTIFYEEDEMDFDIRINNNYYSFIINLTKDYLEVRKDDVKFFTSQFYCLNLNTDNSYNLINKILKNKAFL